MPASFPPISTALYGTGLDGDVTIGSGTTTATRDMHYRTLIINGSGRLDMNGFRLYCSQLLDISAAPANAIICYASNLTAPVTPASNTAGAATAAISNKPLSPLLIGKAGVAGSTTTGTNGTVGTSLGTLSFSGRGGAGSVGGTGNNGANAGGTAGAQGAAGTVNGQGPTMLPNWTWESVPATNLPGNMAGTAGGSGGSGGGNGTNASPGSGASGRGGGMLFIAASAIYCTLSTAFAAISVAGQPGATGGSTPAAGTNNGGSGGGGGGGGGYIYCIAGQLVGSGAPGVLDASGGAGGAGGNGSGNGVGADGAQGGNCGGIDLVVLTRAYTTVLGDSVAGSTTGTAHSGTTGGTGGAGGVARLSL